MKISIPEATLGSASVQQVDVGQVKLGAARVGLLSLRDLKVQASTGLAQLRDVRIALALAFSLEWTAGFVIDADGLGKIDLTRSGALNLGTLELGIGLGHVTLPGLSSLDLDVPDLAVPDLSLVVGALRNLKLGPLLAERVKVQGLAMPPAGFALDGLGLGQAAVQGLAVPGASIDGVTVRRVSGGSLPIGWLAVPGVAFPPVKVPRVGCRKVAADTEPVVTEMPEADAGLLKGTLTVTTTSHLEIGELRLDGIKAAASVGEIALKNVELPFEILDLSLSQIGLERIDVPSMKVN